MTVRKSLQAKKNAVGTSLDQRNGIAQKFIKATDPITDARVFNPIWELIRQHNPISLSGPAGIQYLVCAGACEEHFGQGPDWPCKPLRDLADRLRVTL